MAFQLALDSHSSTVHKDASLNPVLNHSVQPLQDSLQQFPWIIQKEHLPFLIACGIPASGFGTSPHPHAVHKVIETFLLFSHWSFMASTPSSVMFMKPSKFARLRSVNPNFSELVNYRLTAADSVRYPTTSTSLPSHEVVFMHDALMYFVPSQILQLFLSYPNLQRLHCSLVVPPESSFTDLSLHPSVYTYTLHGNTLHYVPEGHHAGSYDQPLSAIRWLKINQIASPHLNLSVKVLESWGPCHSILIQRGLPPLHSKERQTISFRIPKCLALPEATFLHQPLRHRLVPSEVYDALFTYTRAVRTLRTSDPAGFVRTHSNKPQYAWVSSQAWDNLQTYALLNSPVRPNVVFDFFLSPLNKLRLYLSQHLHPIVVKTLPFLAPILPLFKALTPGIPIPVLSDFHLLFCVVIGQRGPLSLAAFPQPLQPLATLMNTRLVHRSFPPPILKALEHFNLLCPKPSAFRLRFLRSLLQWPSWRITLLLSSFAPCLAAFLHFTSPLSLQSLHDGYNAHLHPSDFSLEWSLETFSVPQPTPFLPLHLNLPDPVPEIPMIAPPFPAVPSLRLDPSPPATQPSQPSAPGTGSPAPPAVLDQSHQAPPQSKASTKEPPMDLAFLSLDEDKKVRPASPALDYIPCEALEALPQHLRSINEFGSLNQVPLSMVSPLQNHSSEKENFPESDLLSDPSCCGPIVLFEDLFPGNYHHSNGSFPTRQRSQASSSIPMPEKNCLLASISSQVPYSPQELWNFLCELLPDSLLSNQEISSFGLSTDHLTALCFRLRLECIIHAPHILLPYGLKHSTSVVHISYSEGPPKHFSPYIKLTASAPGSNQSKSALVRSALRFQFNGAFLPFLQAHSHLISVPHAKNLISNMKNGFDGITSQLSNSPGVSPKSKLLELDSLIDVAQPRNVDIIHIAGFAGCGKSHPVQHLLKTKPFRHFRLSVPTNELRSEWKRDLDLPESEAWRLCTWETSLFKSSSVIVIDEIYKLPRGYLDLILLSDPSIQLAILLGDPLQGEYHSTHPSSSNARLPSETIRLAPYIDCYCWWTYRCPKKIADLFGVKTFSDKEGFIRSALSHPQGLPNLVNSIATANTMQNLGHHALTISSSQGMTYSSPVTILLDRHSSLLSPQNGLVALTRSKSGVVFIGNMFQASGHFGTSYIFTQALSNQPVDLMSAFPIYHKLPLIHEPIKSRRHRLVAGDRLPTPSINVKALLPKSLPPHISTSYDRDVLISNPVCFSRAPESRLATLHLPTTRLPLHFDLESCAISDSSASAIPKLPTPFSHCFHGESFEELAAFFLPAHDPSLKEIVFLDHSSSQFPFLDVPFSLSCQPSSLLAASHKPSSDPTLLISSIKKRLRFRPSSAPYSFTPNDILLGGILFESWCRAFGRSTSQTLPFKPALFAECICLNEYAQLSSKAQATIVANASRSDPDWRYTAVRIFAKSQHKVNDGSIFGSWKACQTLALMHDFVILTLGPVKKYQRIIDHFDRPSHIYTHCGKTPSQLNDWSQSFLQGSNFICNDYTSFDQSQHGEAVIFEALKMQRVSIPQHLIDLHIFLKTNVSTQFGPLTCMRLTGEPGTYDDNTDYNLSVIFSQYAISSHPIMVSGDDSVICGSPLERSNWPQIKSLLHLRFKTEFTSLPLFCGYYVGEAGCCRNPFALFAKLMISYDKGNLQETLPSYLYEFSIGHKLGDLVLSLFPSQLIQYYSACFDLFCRKCPPSQKIILSFEPIPESFFLRLLNGSKWVSKTLFSDLPSSLLELMIGFSRLQSSHSDPKVQYLESELLHTFNHGGSQTNQSSTAIHPSARN
ncbi:polyprotein [Scrophularia mottle virus]|uniref:Non-structural replication polyprotein n=1 Tax=Scrophularia mottle virus TaxID=312273 RepID=Q3BD99_9VIRU|nr:polyprotein [Scrophularia mottle virus]AAW88520.1 polyprotein [Scrophularia mottle virus]